MRTFIPIFLVLLLLAVLLAGWAAMPLVLVGLVMVFGVWIALRTWSGKTPTPR